ncbi:hypothetical protein [Streptomyces sp. NRRL S-350]|uniref:hypothetical protein n=1 Tax=Streptomyces sp. NRRL S-350 TaxID=1463902 RepID=UPI00131AE9D3|nr:hypothetical protein [Streptomyces sp. NRRL S-350]
MPERTFTPDDLTGTGSVCGCLICRLDAVFARHLRALRTGYPGTVTMLGHRTAAPGTTAVPHFLTMQLGEVPADIVVWEEMRPDQLKAWLPQADARDRVPQLASRIPRLIRIRQAIRAGTFTPSGSAGAALASGDRYPSFRYLVQHWPTLTKEYTP